jgi:membrane protein DedA with SNARE-associated domain
MEARTKTYGQLLRQWERWFGSAAYPLVFLAPNNVVCLLAGAAGMSVTGFFIANVTGTVVRLYLIRRLGETFEAPIDDVLGFIREFRAPLLVISVTVFAVIMVRELRQTKGEVEAVAEAAAESEADADPPLS